MKHNYTFHIYAYGVHWPEPESFSTKKEAVARGAEWVRECRARARVKLTQVGSFKRLDKVELRIGGRQGYHLWSTAIINRGETR